ncbi:MAG: tRNA-dihydrouridine synthase, partial [Candidatus Eremiobacteraeota bacterium]|nr:tRNA-dihydrouridine synthase [Candidatus Eremiobacteraeota bacterium]
VHYRRMVEELGESRAVPQMRKHVALYLKGMPGSAMLRERIMHIDGAAEAIAVLDETIARLETASAVVAA